MRGRGEKEGLAYPTELTLPERQIMSAPCFDIPHEISWAQSVGVMGRRCLLRGGIRRPASYPYCGGRSNNSVSIARPRLKLMPEKLFLIREYLNVSQPVMAQLLELPKTGRVAEYEKGVREPSLMVTLAYSRLGRVSMASVVDDDVSVNEFRGQLGTFEISITKQDSQG